MEPTVVTVFLAALVTALATGLWRAAADLRSFGQPDGARRIERARCRRDARSVCHPLLAGVDRSPWRTAFGVALGIGFVLASQRYLSHDHVHTLGSLQGRGCAAGSPDRRGDDGSLGGRGDRCRRRVRGGSTLGLLITVAIAIHNIPEGLAISLVLVPRGTSVRAAAGWSIFSSLPQPLLAVPAFLFVNAFSSILPIGLGFAAGAMVWMVVGELLPEALAAAPRRVVAVVGQHSLLAHALLPTARALVTAPCSTLTTASRPHRSRALGRCGASCSITPRDAAGR